MRPATFSLRYMAGSPKASTLDLKEAKALLERDLEPEFCKVAGKSVPCRAQLGDVE
jgi:hypothetical protein